MARPQPPAVPRCRWIALALLLAGAFALGLWLRLGQPLGSDVSGHVPVTDIADAPGYPSTGPADADVTLVVFSDYACPVCRATQPALDAAVRADGRVRVVDRDWPIFGPASTHAARVALAAQYQGIYQPVHDALMRAPNLEDATLQRAVEQAGGSWAKLQADLKRHGPAIDALITGSGEDALRLGLPGTPGYLVGPIRIVGAASEKQFRDAIARARSIAS